MTPGGYNFNDFRESELNKTQTRYCGPIFLLSWTFFPTVDVFSVAVFSVDLFSEYLAMMSVSASWNAGLSLRKTISKLSKQDIFSESDSPLTYSTS